MVKPEETGDQIEQRAAEWVVRLGGPPFSQPERLGFEAWLARSECHARAFEIARATWVELGGIGPLDDMPPVARVAPTLAPGATRRARPVAVAFRASALVAAIAMTVGGGLFWYGDPLVALAADYRAAPGENVTARLPDGSSVELGSGSAISLHFDAAQRRVELLAGVAYFTAAPKGGAETRPFVVEGSGGTATALGTQFAVGRLIDGVEVTVAEHSVEVAEGSDSVVLQPGQSVRYQAGRGLGPVHQRDVEQSTAWRRGRLIFDQVPLSEVVEELNRYRRGRIVVTSELGNRKVSGVFTTIDLDGALATIARELGASIASLPPLVTLLY